eukprot:9478828-Pyramimonas_sp.AAC.1
MEIAMAVDPIKDEMADVRSRLSALESRPASSSSSALSARHPVSPQFHGRVELADCIHRRPRNSQQMSKASYAQFASERDARTFLQSVRGKGTVFQTSSSRLTVKPAKS